MDLDNMADKMNEDDVMGVVFKALHQGKVQMVHAEHPNNQIMFTPEGTSKWLITVTEVAEETMPAT